MIFPTIVLAGLAMAQAAPSPSPRPDPAIERLQWSKATDGAEPITAIDIRNDFGDIRARSAANRVLDVTMTVQRLDPANERVGFTVERRGSAIALVVAYPPGRVRDANAHPAKDSYDRLDLVVFVPAGVTLRAHTLRGRVEVRGVKSDVDAVTEDGPIYLANKGAMVARTTSGSITALPDAGVLAEAGAPLILQTDTGAIDVTLSGQPGPELRAESGGEMTTALPVQRTKQGTRARVASVAEPRAVRLLLISSRTGAVRIVRDDP